MSLDRQEQLDLLLEHYRNPCCRKKLKDADSVVPGGNPGCGDVVTVFLKVAPPEGPDDGEGRVAEASFLGDGCTISQAAASMLMEMVKEERPSLRAVLDMDYEEMIEMLGRETVSSRPRCATLALGTLKAAVRRYLDEKRRRDAGLA